MLLSFVYCSYDYWWPHENHEIKHRYQMRNIIPNKSNFSKTNESTTSLELWIRTFFFLDNTCRKRYQRLFRMDALGIINKWGIIPLMRYAVKRNRLSWNLHDEWQIIAWFDVIKPQTRWTNYKMSSAWPPDTFLPQPRTQLLESLK